MFSAPRINVQKGRAVQGSSDYSFNTCQMIAADDRFGDIQGGRQGEAFSALPGLIEAALPNPNA